MPLSVAGIQAITALVSGPFSTPGVEKVGSREVFQGPVLELLGVDGPEQNMVLLDGCVTEVNQYFSV
ncbi:hypothetical protein MNKW57_26990 [Biformimicrobium ophioploci]|uniref:Uncharacterized protein n=1 Tax=Biformimicrobium ophioploci TaxID=3036711 RepID=A0ABQ6M1Z5_9GAMM|nr:hypothetical protein MNKW57_26990 [Microbulbifer sp. NKW57]